MLQFSTLLQFPVLLQFVFYKKQKTNKTSNNNNKNHIEFCVVLFSACKGISLLDKISVSICCINLCFKRCCLQQWFVKSMFSDFLVLRDLVVYFCKFGLVSALVFLLHKNYFESVTFFFWTLLLPLILIIYSGFWLCFGLQGNRIN